MAGKPNTAWLATMVAKHGSREAVTEVQRKNGAKGGSNSNNGGFGSGKVGSDGLTGHQRAVLAGALGGRISRRKPKNANGSN